MLALSKQASTLTSKTSEILDKIKADADKAKIKFAPSRAIIITGDWTSKMVDKLKEKTKDLSYEIIDPNDTIDDEQLDKKLGIAKVILSNFGFNLIFSFNLSYQRDWTYLEPKDKADSKINMEIAEVFRNTMRDEIYRILGIVDIHVIISQLARKYPLKTWGKPPRFKNFEANYDT